MDYTTLKSWKRIFVLVDEEAYSLFPKCWLLRCTSPQRVRVRVSLRIGAPGACASAPTSDNCRAQKIELAYTFVEQSALMQSPAAQSGSSDSSAGFMKMRQFVGFISERVQSALIKSSKPGEQVHNRKKYLHTFNTIYWAVLKFCLVSGFLHPFTSVSPTLMRSLTSAILVSP